MFVCSSTVASRIVSQQGSAGPRASASIISKLAPGSRRSYNVKQKVFSSSSGSSNTYSTSSNYYFPAVLAAGVTAAGFVTIQQQQVTGCEESHSPQKKDCYKEKIYEDMRRSFADNGNQSHYFNMAPPLPRIIYYHIQAKTLAFLIFFLMLNIQTYRITLDLYNSLALFLKLNSDKCRLLLLFFNNGMYKYLSWYHQTKT